jgi:hypothetical protein
MGSHSTRTAHPYFLDGIRSLWNTVGVPAQIRNPYEHMTKGEMVATQTKTPKFKNFAAETVSCGKWKRRNQQCGRCVPCLIRRASLYAGHVQDASSYQSPDLHSVMTDEDVRDDLIAVRSAILRLRNGDPKRWVLQAGPLPAAPAIRDRYFGVATRGLNELASYLRAEGFVS